MKRGFGNIRCPECPDQPEDPVLFMQHTGIKADAPGILILKAVVPLCHPGICLTFYDQAWPAVRVDALIHGFRQENVSVIPGQRTRIEFADQTVSGEDVRKIGHNCDAGDLPQPCGAADGSCKSKIQSVNQNRIPCLPGEEDSEKGRKEYQQMSEHRKVKDREDLIPDSVRCFRT